MHTRWLKTIVLPTLIVCSSFAAALARGWQGPINKGEWAASVAFATVFVGLMLVAFVRRPDLWGWSFAIATAWLLVDAASPTTPQHVTLLIGIAVLLSLAMTIDERGRLLEREQRDAENRTHTATSRQSVAIAAGVCAAFGLLTFSVRIIDPTWFAIGDVGGSVVVGAGTVFAVLLHGPPKTTKALEPSIRHLTVVACVLGLSLSALYRFIPAHTMLGTRFMTLGAVLGLAMAGIASRQRISERLVISCASAMLALGGLQFALAEQSRLLGPMATSGGSHRSLLTSTPLLIFACCLIVSTIPILQRAESTLLASAPSLARIGRAGSAATTRTLDAVSSAQKSLDRRIARWRPIDTRSHIATQTARRRMAAEWLIPAGMWTIGTFVVSSLAASASLAGGHLPKLGQFHWTTAFLTDHTGRLGWGTGDYWAIADHGYILSEHREAFLPFLPMVLRILKHSTGLQLDIVQLIVASASGLASVLLMWAWLQRRGFETGTRVAALALYLLFPWNFLLFGYGYADATVVALTLAALLLLESDHPNFAGIVAAAAVTTRPNGVPIVLIFGLMEAIRCHVVEITTARGGLGLPWSKSRWLTIRPRSLRKVRWTAIAFPLLALAALSAYMWHHAGEPLYWITQESHFGHEPVTSLSAWLKSLFQIWPTAIISSKWEWVNQMATAIVLVVAMMLIPKLHRRFGVVYAVFAILIWCVAWTGSRVFTPSARLLMPITPFAAALVAPWFSRHQVMLTLTLTAFGVGSATLIVLFTKGGSLWVGW